MKENIEKLNFIIYKCCKIIEQLNQLESEYPELHEDWKESIELISLLKSNSESIVNLLKDAEES